MSFLSGAFKKTSQADEQRVMQDNEIEAGMGGNPLHYQTHVKKKDTVKRSKGKTLHHGGK